jgi:hypothetical protein
MFVCLIFILLKIAAKKDVIAVFRGFIVTSVGIRAVEVKKVKYSHG